ncbi:hypothetical protein ABPG72_005501 [Tetrahymena utriculariae]
MSINEKYSPEKLPPLSSSRNNNKNYRQNPFQNNSLHNQSFQSSQTKGQKNLAHSLVSTRTQIENSMIRSFRQANNPFDQGYTRSDKIRYQGSPESKAHQRLHEFCTISSLQHSGYHQPRYQQSQKVSGIENLRKTFQKNKIMQQIIEEEEIVTKDPKLMTNIESLWKMNLLNDKRFVNNSLAKKQNIAYVYNDYHSRSTNPGYSRNDMGGAFFTR